MHHFLPQEVKCKFEFGTLKEKNHHMMSLLMTEIQSNCFSMICYSFYKIINN